MNKIHVLTIDDAIKVLQARQKELNVIWFELDHNQCDEAGEHVRRERLDQMYDELRPIYAMIEALQR